jgi:hypothetical protein
LGAVMRSKLEMVIKDMLIRHLKLAAPVWGLLTRGYEARQILMT